MIASYPLTAMIATSLAVSGCGDPPPKYVLVHGAWMGAAGWTQTADDLRAEGADVTTLELPAHGADHTPASQVSLDAYVTTVSNMLEAATTHVILVAHSMGGIVITQAAEQHPDNIERLVYVAAYLPGDGQSLFDLAMSDADSQIGPSLEFEQDGTIDIAQDAFPDLFCADCAADGRAALVAGYRAEPAMPLQQPVSITAARAGSVAKTYVHTTQDRVVSPSLQDRMVAATHVDRTATMATSHAAMLSQPHQLASILLAQ